MNDVRSDSFEIIAAIEGSYTVPLNPVHLLKDTSYDPANPPVRSVTADPDELALVNPFFFVAKWNTSAVPGILQLDRS